ncbi:acylphosphatase [Candidatus Babela massiliensis]|uniref:Acylphosphatase n=1 Tax=Candidatus Babela massiliensis TaxID=673862 RepID=V6DFS1_9BACT|nr:acylphosphatase [Candidatus Babela massiliensis]CDK30389.1 Acylphosphatase [Candidatus Babela massiliensis]
MNKCLRINIILETLENKEENLKNIIQRFAKKHELEGLAQSIDHNHIKVIVCGEKENVDNFVDKIHKEISTFDIQDIEIEPFTKDKDYRGVFRLIE